MRRFTEWIQLRRMAVVARQRQQGYCLLPHQPPTPDGEMMPTWLAQAPCRYDEFFWRRQGAAVGRIAEAGRNTAWSPATQLGREGDPCKLRQHGPTRARAPEHLPRRETPLAMPDRPLKAVARCTATDS